MKKIISILMTITLLLAFTACSNNEQKENKTTNSSSALSESGNTAEDSAANKNRFLVVYFSASGNTKTVAEYIASTVDGDLFELLPKNAYTADDLNWRDSGSRVNYEHDNENARDIELVSTTIDCWAEYDTVFIGYPIWWGIAAWVVDGFVKANDFTDKTVIPFCTSASSGFGESGRLLEEMAGTGSWIEGKRFRESVSQSDVEDWVNSLSI